MIFAPAQYQSHNTVNKCMETCRSLCSAIINTLTYELKRDYYPVVIGFIEFTGHKILLMVLITTLARTLYRNTTNKHQKNYEST